MTLLTMLVAFSDGKPVSIFPEMLLYQRPPRMTYSPRRHPEVRASSRASKGDGPDVAAPGASGNGGGRSSFEARARKSGLPDLRI